MKKLNILNGEALKKYFLKNFDAERDDIISFNECLVDGELHENIFSEDFFSLRERFITKNFNLPPEEYRQKSVNELKTLLNNKYENIILWFDFDLFCQINMLTILAYLNYVKFNGLVRVNIIKQDFFYYSQKEIIENEIELDSIDNFYNLYVDILIKKDFEKADSDLYQNIFKQLPYLKEGIRLYRKYKGSNSEIIDFINKRRGKSRKDILIDLIKNLNHYGLGDTQYMRILDEMGIKD
jgi:hypothetical protein